MNFREQIKKQAQYLEDIENLERLIKEGFLEKPCWRDNKPEEFKISGGLIYRSGIDGSVNQRMWKKAQECLAEFEKSMREEAQKIIEEYMKGN